MKIYLVLEIRSSGLPRFNLLTSMTLNDLEPLKKRFLMNFSQFLDAAHISTPNCDEMAGDRPRQHAYEIFSTQRRF